VARTRLLVVDDDRRLCALAAPLLETDFDVRFAHGAREAETIATVFAPHVAVVDLGLPDGDGIDVIAKLSCRAPEVAILVLTIASAEARILAALRAGARGYLLKEDLGRLRRAVDEVLAGESPMSAGVAKLVLLHVRGTPTMVAGSEPRGTLTARELEVVNGLRNGMSYGEVGELLGVSTNTIRTYIRSVYEKLRVSSKTEAVLEALRLGLLP
jgi:DNA-binding NarL/FixJ family response regulator